LASSPAEEEQMDPKPKPTADQLAAMTPVEIDTALYGLYLAEGSVENRLMASKVAVRRAAGDEQDSRTRRWGMSYTRALVIVNQLAEDGRDAAWTALDALRVEQVAVSRVRKAMKVYEDEFDRRGGWTRAFLATSVGGHVHNGMECSTCHNGEFRTRFSWQVQYSGQSEEEIVKAAGVRACTTCYPDAPTEDLNRPTVMFTEDEITAQAAREERQAAKTVREATRTAKGITAPDGSPLRDSSGSRIETERAAVIEATDGLSERYKNLRREQIITADPGLEPFFTDRTRRTDNEARARANAMHLIEAIAHKQGTTADAVLAELEPKALAKAKRDLGGKDFVPTFRYGASFQTEEFDAYTAKCKAEGRKPFEALTLRWAKF
jgi:hypothetical protein